MIRFDKTSRSIVAVCACGAREVVNHEFEADAWARRHLDVAHPDPTAQRAGALTASRMRAQRR